VVEDMGYHEDPNYPGTGAHYWSAQTDDGTCIVLADPERKRMVIGEETPVVCRIGSPGIHAGPVWVWARNRSHIHFNPPIAKGRSELDPDTARLQ
jgi:hypothetical protein